jgi:hypothetical protein
MTCFDGLSELADIAVGDPWMASPADHVNFHHGWSFVLIRSRRGEELFEKACLQKTIGVHWLERREALACNHRMATEKRRRAFCMLRWRAGHGLPVPDYGFKPDELPRLGSVAWVKTQLNLLTHLFCFFDSGRAGVFKFFLGGGGYVVLWLNNQRRSLRLWLRDTIANVTRLAGNNK